MQNRTIIIRTSSYRRTHARLLARGIRVIANRHLDMHRQEWVVAVPTR